MNTTKITCLGHGGAFSAADVGNTSYLVEHENHRILIDCGNTVPDVLKEFGIDPGSLTAIVVTHLHGDHVNGLERLLYHRHYICKAKPIDLIMGPDTALDWLACVRATKNDLERHVRIMRAPNPGQFGSAGVNGDFSRVSLGCRDSAVAVRVNHGGDVHAMHCYCFTLNLASHRLFFSGDRIWYHHGCDVVYESMVNSTIAFHELELFSPPSGAHTNVADVTGLVTTDHIWWGHHGSAAPFYPAAPHLKLAHKGDEWTITDGKVEQTGGFKL